MDRKGENSCPGRAFSHLNRLLGFVRSSAASWGCQVSEGPASCTQRWRGSLVLPRGSQSPLRAAGARGPGSELRPPAPRQLEGRPTRGRPGLVYGRKQRRLAESQTPARRGHARDSATFQHNRLRVCPAGRTALSEGSGLSPHNSRNGAPVYREKRRGRGARDDVKPELSSWGLCAS